MQRWDRYAYTVNNPVTDVPESQGVQAWDRFAYSNNNPVTYKDPSGHATCNESTGECYDRGHQTVSQKTGSTQNLTFEEMYGISFDDDNWTEGHKNQVKSAVWNVAAKLGGAEGFRDKYGSVNFTWDTTDTRLRTDAQNNNPACANNFTGDCAAGGGFTENAHHIIFASMSGDCCTDQFERGVKNVVHELGHAYADTFCSWGPTGNGASSMTEEMAGERYLFLAPNDPAGRLDWQQHPDSTNTSEVFAEMFIAYTYDHWNQEPQNAQNVADAQAWMNKWVP